MQINWGLTADCAVLWHIKTKMDRSKQNIREIHRQLELRNLQQSEAFSVIINARTYSYKLLRTTGIKIPEIINH